MAFREDDEEGNLMKSIKDRDKDEVSDCSSSDFSPQPGPAKTELPGQSGPVHRGGEVAAVCDGNPPRESSDQNRSSPLLFNPNEKGTKKQKRCDYDSDARSYEGLGFEYKRRNLSTIAKKDSFLPGTTKMVDFDSKGNKAWGGRLLFETMNDSEIDSLVGLATSYDLSCDRNKIDGNSKTNCRRNGDIRKSVDVQTISRSADEDMFHDPQRHNPLLSATFDSPLPPSHIDYVKSRIRHHILKPCDENQEYRKNEYENNQGENIDMTFKDSVPIAMSMYLEECLTASLLPLAGLHALRCQALEAMSSKETEFCATPVASFGNNKDDGNQRRREIHNDNNLAYALKRTVPHPITGEQVKLDMNKQIRWKEENSFDEWTLPPEEAILKLMEQGFLSDDSPYQFVPDASRSWISTDLLGANHQKCNDVLKLSPLDIAMWAKSCKVNPRVLSNNREIFDIFQPQKTAALAKELQHPPL